MGGMGGMMYLLHGRHGRDDVLSQFLTVPAGAIRAARELRVEISKRTTSIWADRSASTGGISEIAMNVSQPVLTDQLTNLLKNTVVIGDAGQGKSTLLYQISAWHQQNVGIPSMVIAALAEDFVAADGCLQENLFDAILFNADLAAISGLRTIAVVDGLDQIPQQVRASLAKVLGKLSAYTHVTCLTSCRRPDWNTSQSVRDALQDFQIQEMPSWTPELVASILEQFGVTRTLSSSLLALAGTPLYLDLIVRTFGGGVRVPVEVATRHGLFKEFWKANVLSTDAADACRNLLDKVVSALVRGHYLDTRTCSADAQEASALERLVSLGILAKDSMRGLIGFRHPLIAAFAAGQWLIVQGDDIYKTLLSIASPFTRFTIHRSLLESILDSETALQSTLTLPAYCAGLPDLLYDDVADILSTIILKPEAALAVFDLIKSGVLPPRVFRSATHYENQTWLDIVAMWPGDAAWFQAQEWTSIELLDSVMKYARGLGKKAAIDRMQKVASRLRNWSDSEKVRQESSFYYWLKARLVELTAEYSPDVETIAWQRTIPPEYHATRITVLQSLPLIATRNKHDPAALTAIASNFCTFAGVTRTDGQCQVDEAFWSTQLQDHSAIEWCLVGTNSKLAEVGLIRISPQIFVPVGMDLYEALWRREEPKRVKRRKELVRLIAKTAGEANSDTLPMQLDDNSIEVEDESSDVDDQTQMLDDSPEYRFWRKSNHRDDNFQIADAIHEVCGECAKTNPEDFMARFYPILRASRLATFQTILFDIALTKLTSPHRENVLVDRLLDCRLYRIRGMMFWVEDATRVVWPSLGESERAALVENVVAMPTDSELNVEFCVPHFLCQIPEEYHPPQFREEVVKLRAQDHHHPLSDPRRGWDHSHSYGSLDRSKVETIEASGWKPDELGRKMREFHQLGSKIGHNDRTPPSNFAQIVAAVSEIGPLLPSNISEIEKDHWLLDVIGRVLGLSHLAAGKTKSPEYWPTAEATRAILDLSLSVVERNAAVSDPSELGDDSSFFQSPLREALDCIDAALLHPDLIDDHALRNRFASIAHMCLTSSLSKLHALFFHGVRRYHWFKNTAMTANLADAFTRHSSGDSLKWALPHLFGFQTDACKDVLEGLFARSELPKADLLAPDLGEVLGQLGMQRGKSWERSRPAEFLDRVTSEKITGPLAASNEIVAKFYRGIVFGLKEFAGDHYRKKVSSDDYCKWIKNLWIILSSAPLQSVDRPSNFWLFALHWVSDALKAPDSAEFVRPWFLPLLPTIVDAVERGAKNDVYTIFHQLQEDAGPLGSGGIISQLDPDWTLSLVGKAVTRVATSEVDIQVGNISSADWTSWVNVLDEAGSAAKTMVESGALKRNQIDLAVTLLERLSRPPFSSTKCEAWVREVRDALEGA